jgi:hypothetical protein
MVKQSGIYIIIIRKVINTFKLYKKVSGCDANSLKNYCKLFYGQLELIMG